MTKPTDQELLIALKKAAEMKEQGNDPDFIAKALLNAHYREQYLEKIFHLAERYLLFGQAEHEHRELLKAIDDARRREAQISKHEQSPSLGL